LTVPTLHTERIPNSPNQDGKKSGASGNPDGSAFFTRIPYPGLDGVLDKMKELADQGKGDPIVREKAVSITKNIPKDPRTNLPNRRNYQQIADAVYMWMKKNIEYINDPDGIEWLQTAKKTIELGYGDCDDQSVLAAALLSSIGVPTRFKVVKANPDRRNAYSHVYLQYHDKDRWKGFDPTLHTKAGDELSDHHIFGSKTVDLSGVEIVNSGNFKLFAGISLVVGISYLAYRHKSHKNI